MGFARKAVAHVARQQSLSVVWLFIQHDPSLQSTKGWINNGQRS